MVSSCLLDAARRGETKALLMCTGLLCLLVGIVSSVAESFRPQDGLLLSLVSCSATAAGIILVVCPCLNLAWFAGVARLPQEEPSDDEGAHGCCTVTVADVETFLSLLPTLFTGNIAFSAIYNSHHFLYQAQACQMDTRVFNVQLSGSFFHVANCVGVLIATPLTVYLINPTLERQLGFHMGFHMKFTIGMFLAAFSSVIGIMLEVARRNAEVLPIESNCAPPGVHMSDQSAFWMVLPYFIMGVGEIYCNPALMRLVYTKNPASMRALAAATSFFVHSVSSGIFPVLIYALQKYLPDDLNDGHLEYGYLANIGLGAGFLIVFWAIALQRNREA